MPRRTNKLAPGLHKDHTPAVAENFHNYKRIHSTELIVEGLIIARRGEDKEGNIVFSLSEVAGVVRNDGLDGGGVAKLHTIWHSDLDQYRYRKTSASFRSLKDNHNSYRVYPFNVSQPLPIPEPEPEKRPEIVVGPPLYDLADPTMSMYDNKHSSYERETDEAFLAINKDNNRLLTEILATLKELKEKW